MTAVLYSVSGACFRRWWHNIKVNSKSLRRGKQWFAEVRELSLKKEINEILRHTPFSFTSRPSVINIFHAKHASGGSQAIKVPHWKFLFDYSRDELFFTFAVWDWASLLPPIFSCDGEWINTRPENNPLSTEYIDHLLSFHERSRHTKRDNF